MPYSKEGDAFICSDQSCLPTFFLACLYFAVSHEPILDESTLNRPCNSRENQFLALDEHMAWSSSWYSLVYNLHIIFDACALSYKITGKVQGFYIVKSLIANSTL